MKKLESHSKKRIKILNNKNSNFSKRIRQFDKVFFRAVLKNWCSNEVCGQ